MKITKMFSLKCNNSKLVIIKRFILKDNFLNPVPYANNIVKSSNRQCMFNLNNIPVCSLNTFVNQKHETFNEKEFLVKLKYDPDVFGESDEKDLLDDGDIAEEKSASQRIDPSRKLSTKKYADIIKDLIRKRKIKEAIDVLETRMLKEEQVKPENYIYNLLLGACGRVGYTKKAFSLYNDMKKRGLIVHPGAYTALFNACANSPWTEDGLSRAKHLREIMIEKMYEPNDTNYNAMIKAFGRCGDLSTAFTIVDEMIMKKIKLRDDTINFLLQACITDKESGFRHALLVWRKLMEKRIKPSTFTYNLMLRSVRDCGLGNLETTRKVLNQIISEANKKKNVQLEGQNTKLLMLSSNEKMFFGSQDTNKSSNVSGNLTFDNSRPNLMAKTPHLGHILSISEVTKPEDRLLLVGGMSGFLENMDNFRLLPDIKTFTQLLSVIPSTLAAEEELISAMKKRNIKPDISFYNTLIKKRSLRFDYEGAKEVVQIMKNQRFEPDLITYGILSLGCKTKEEALEFLDEIESAGHRINAEILGAMLHQACFHENFSYVIELLNLCKKKDVPPNLKFIERLDEFKRKCKKISQQKQNPQIWIKGYQLFRMKF